MATKDKVRPLYERFDFDFRNAMRSRLVERDEEIEIFILALLAKTHAFFGGEPGIAKSMLVETGMGLIDGLTDDDYFHILMMKSTTREDVFGPLRLSLLAEDRYAYKSEGYLPTARFVFGDEFWKANAAIQNALLWATNERKYRNDGKVIEIPLWSMFIASNETPKDEALQAIYDRFPLRKWVEPIREPGNFVGMLKLGENTLEPVVSWEDIEQAHKEVMAVEVPGDVLEALSDIKDKLRELSILPSDRRFRTALNIVRAKAWLDGETEADVEHLRPLRHVLWVDPDHYKEVDKLLIGLANPIDLEIMEIEKDLGGVSAELDRVINDPQPGDVGMQERIGTQLFEKVEKAMAELTGISARLKGSKKRSAKMESAKEQVLVLLQRLLKRVFNMSDEDIEESELMQFAQVDDDDDEGSEVTADA